MKSKPEPKKLPTPRVGEYIGELASVMIKRKHTVTFFSPGSFVAETTTKDIGEWDTREAMRMAGGIVERYGARPAGFYFMTLVTADPVPDGAGGFLDVTPRLEKTSGSYYINGTALDLAGVELLHGAESILARNMRCNHWDRVVTTSNGYSMTSIFNDADAIVNADGEITLRGPKHELA